MLYTLHFTLHVLHATLYTPDSTLYTPHSTLYTSHSSHFTLHTWRYNHKILTMTIKLMILMLVFLQLKYHESAQGASHPLRLVHAFQQRAPNALPVLLVIDPAGFPWQVCLWVVQHAKIKTEYVYVYILLDMCIDTCICTWICLSIIQI